MRKSRESGDGKFVCQAYDDLESLRRSSDRYVISSIRFREFAIDSMSGFEMKGSELPIVISSIRFRERCVSWWLLGG